MYNNRLSKPFNAKPRMKKTALTLFSVLTTMTIAAQNPLLETFETPHATAPFHLIRTEHYEPALREGIRLQKAEIEAICNNPETPTFHNTIEALEHSGRTLARTETILGNLLSAETNDELEAVANQVIPMLTSHGNDILLNEKLFARIKYVYEHRSETPLSAEEEKLLEDTYGNFARNGANLDEAGKEAYRRITQERAKLGLQFKQNLLKATNSYELVLTDPAQVEGMPESVLETARQSAQEKGKDGWRFDLSAPSYSAFMTYNPHRELRRKLYLAYGSKTAQGNEYDNKEVVRQLANTALQKANLLGYPSHAAYSLQETMAENSQAVYQLLEQLLEAYKPTAVEEVDELQQFARQIEGDDFTLMPWDWSFYSEKLKDTKYNLNDEMLRPYFELGQVIDGVFGLATRLYGITFKENPQIPVYHPDVKAFDVFDADGSFMAVLYTDFYPRAGKRAGAWMTEFKGQWKENGENSRPHITIVMNFNKPTGDKPALLTFDEVNTFLHEFGHSLHGMFANTTYSQLSGTSVYRDFVELPSQLMENFATQKAFLGTFARHYQSGEVIPDTLIQRLVDAANYHAAYACIRQVSFGLLDMAWYTLQSPYEGDIKAFEQKAWARAQLLPSVEETCMSTQFSHIFSGGYAAGYYSYKWAEVLDADAFSLFQEKGVISREVAESFRRNILEKGGTEHPMQLYLRFRGRKPSIDALLKRNGIQPLSAK